MYDQRITLEKFDAFVKDETRKKAICNSIRNRFRNKNIIISDEDLSDIFQDSVFVLYNKIGTELKSSKDNSLERYFYSICINQTLKFLRKNGKTIVIDINDTFFSNKNKIVSSQVQKIIQATSKSQTDTPPDEALDQKMIKERVHKALNNMSERCRQLLTKFYLEGFSWAETAELLELANAESAKSAANQCRKRFKEKYKELETYIQDK